MRHAVAFYTTDARLNINTWHGHGGSHNSVKYWMPIPEFKG